MSHRKTECEVMSEKEPQSQEERGDDMDEVKT